MQEYLPYMRKYMQITCRGIEYFIESTAVCVMQFYRYIYSTQPAM